MSDWFDTGYEGKVQEDSNKDKVFRFYMKDGETKQVTFIDDDKNPTEFEIGEGESKVKRQMRLPVIFSEHQMKIDNNWKNWFTCLKPRGEACPACDAGDRPYQAAAFSVIDHSEWKDRNGKTHKDQTKLYIVKTNSPSYALIKKLSSKRDGLRGAKVEISRIGDKSPSIGNQFDFESKVALPFEVKPLNYFDLLRPKTAQELARAIGKSAEAHNSDEGEAEEGAASVPW